MKSKTLYIQCKGAQFGRLYVPPFKLFQGEFSIIYLFHGPHFWDIMLELAEILTGKRQHKQFVVHKPLIFVEHIQQGKLRSTFRPLTVKRYFKSHGLNNIEISQDYFQDDRVKPQTKISHLPGNPRKKISLLATLSYSKDIVFDLTGVDPKGGKEIFEFVKEVVAKGGTAILLDGYDNFKDDNIKFIRAIEVKD